MGEEFPVQDPFLDESLMQQLKMLYQVYAGAINAGFPEPRAFELVQNLFLTQISAAINAQDT
jgi:hypothetical protein